ncbi:MULTISPECIES: secretion protein HlyD [unclassified Ensifer]|uniref:secretion protein HlyD n=1 Tax=unclassified Ensifer TaxID=2633371 RepID=UPI00081308DF|nr:MULTISPECIES: secretion protein HlyD [unclassified Ensifer]OCO98445.1 secretion protein HlyD [Ensifer sp. LC11]OCP05576.1 secretion protein HlyD [Ensifer sp. LC13]OCP13551.1 secretion protein HlyD [Ensifer sp. LC14]OCP30746.1 secretion protein HlyD [Ensifer sp. LC499]
MNKPAITLILMAGAAAGAWWFELPQRLGWAATERTSVLYGNVDIRQVSLGFRVSGRIAGLAVDEGDTVKPGDVLASLDAAPFEQAEAAAEAELGSLKANLAKLKAGARPTEIAQARATHEERLADLENANLAYDRARQLRPNGTISQANLDEASANRAAAAARATSAREALALLEEGSRIEDIEAAQAQVLAAEAKLESARTSLADTRLLAPSAGTVLSRVREAGAIVAPSDMVYVISLNEPVWVRAYVAEPELGRVHPGMAVEVTSDTAPGRPYKGTVGFISPVAEFTPKSVETPELRTDLVYRLRIVVGKPGPDLRQGMPVTVHLPKQEGG